VSPEEILAELRDVHLPPAPEGAAVSAGFAWWPPVAFALLALLTVAVRVWRRGAWRRSARARLASVEGDPDRLRRLAAMTRLFADMARIGHAGRAPDCVHRPPERIGPAEEARLRGHLGAAVRRRHAP